jgi:hypothetical protein
METIRAIIFEDGDQWVAQCLEYDIAVQGEDLDTVRSRLLVAIRAEAEAGIEFHGEPFKAIEPAPRHFHDMWARKGTRFRDTSSIGGASPITVEQSVAA